jgi:hypothetical protein
MLIGDVCKMIGMGKLERPLDKPRLKKVNESYKQASSSSIVPRQQDPDKIKRLILSWSKKTNVSAVARLFRDIILNDGTMDNETVKTYFKTQTFVNNLTDNHKGNYRLIFRKTSQNHYVTLEAMEYYNTLQ